jgi:superfamily II DNA or RNA helicase
MCPEILEKLRTHQRAPAEQLLQILKSGGVAFDLSDTGTGKTFVGAAIAAELQVPALAIVPKIAETAWHEAAAHFGDKI